MQPTTICGLSLSRNSQSVFDSNLCVRRFIDGIRSDKTRVTQTVTLIFCVSLPALVIFLFIPPLFLPAVSRLRFFFLARRFLFWSSVSILRFPPTVSLLVVFLWRSSFCGSSLRVMPGPDRTPLNNVRAHHSLVWRPSVAPSPGSTPEVHNPSPPTPRLASACRSLTGLGPGST